MSQNTSIYVNLAFQVSIFHWYSYCLQKYRLPIVCDLVSLIDKSPTGVTRMRQVAAGPREVEELWCLESKLCVLWYSVLLPLSRTPWLSKPAWVKTHSKSAQLRPYHNAPPLSADCWVWIATLSFHPSASTFNSVFCCNVCSTNPGRNAFKSLAFGPSAVR